MTSAFEKKKQRCLDLAWEAEGKYKMRDNIDGLLDGHASED